MFALGFAGRAECFGMRSRVLSGSTGGEVDLPEEMVGEALLAAKVVERASLVREGKDGLYLEHKKDTGQFDFRNADIWLELNQQLS